MEPSLTNRYYALERYLQSWTKDDRGSVQQMRIARDPAGNQHPDRHGRPPSGYIFFGLDLHDLAEQQR